MYLFINHSSSSACTMVLPKLTFVLLCTPFLSLLVHRWWFAACVLWLRCETRVSAELARVLLTLFFAWNVAQHYLFPYFLLLWSLSTAKLQNFPNTCSILYRCLVICMTKTIHEKITTSQIWKSGRLLVPFCQTRSHIWKFSVLTQTAIIKSKLFT